MCGFVVFDRANVLAILLLINRKKVNITVQDATKVQRGVEV